MNKPIGLVAAVPLLIALCGSMNAQVQPRWRTLTNSPSASSRHDDVFFVNPRVGWIVNGAGRIYRTGDGGATWQLQYDAPVYLRAVGFADSLRGWVGSLDSAHVLYSTTDGGATWTEVQNFPDPQPHGICGLWVVNDSIVCGSGAYFGSPRFIKSTDRGGTWMTVDLSSLVARLVDCYFLNADSGFVVGATGASLSNAYAKILFTSDGGITWVPRFTGNTAGELCWKISFSSATVGNVSIEPFHSGATYYLRTIDRGATWEEVLFINSHYDVQGIGFSSDSVGWIGGWTGPTYETTDAGTSWHLAGFGSVINRFRILSDTLGYAVGQRVYKYSRDSTTVGVQNNTDLPLIFTLDQNYPNPFNPTTTIRYTLPSARSGDAKERDGGESFVALGVFDMLGREVATLVSEVKAPGTHRATWDAKQEASGVYFYVLRRGDFQVTRKMVLIR